MPPKKRAENLFGPTLESVRQHAWERSLTQEEMATVLGCSRSTLANIEAGRRLPNDSLLKKLARFVGAQGQQEKEIYHVLKCLAVMHAHQNRDFFASWQTARSLAVASTHELPALLKRFCRG